VRSARGRRENFAVNWNGWGHGIFFYAIAVRRG
jgi:hypothetical protein